MTCRSDFMRKKVSICDQLRIRISDKIIDQQTYEKLKF